MSEPFLSLPVAVGIPEKRARFLFRVRSEKARPNDEQLAATQSHGVLSQKRYMEITGNKVVAALAGTENFNHVERDDFVISLRTFEGGIERAAETGCISPAYTVLAPSHEVEPSFYQYLLKSRVFISHLQTTVTGIRDGKSVKFENFANIVLPLPDLATQKSIADFLDRETARIDQLIEKKQRLVEVLRMKRQATISNLTVKGLNPNASMRDTGISWFGEIPEHWEMQPIKYLVSRPVTDGPHVTPVKCAQGVPFISAEAISDGVINFEKKWGYISPKDHQVYSRSYKPKRGDIFVVKLGATAGRVARVETCDDFNIWVPLAAIRPKTELLSKLIYYSLQSSQVGDAYQVLWTYGTQQTLGLRTLSNLRMPIPPDHEIEDIVEKIEAKLPQIEAATKSTGISTNRLREYRAALITAAVTGQIDVTTYGKQGATDRTLDRIEEEMGNG